MTFLAKIINLLTIFAVVYIIDALYLAHHTENRLRKLNPRIGDLVRFKSSEDNNNSSNEMEITANVIDMIDQEINWLRAGLS